MFTNVPFTTTRYFSHKLELHLEKINLFVCLLRPWSVVCYFSCIDQIDFLFRSNRLFIYKWKKKWTFYTNRMKKNRDKCTSATTGLVPGIWHTRYSAVIMICTGTHTTHILKFIYWSKNYSVNCKFWWEAPLEVLWPVQFFIIIRPLQVYEDVLNLLSIFCTEGYNKEIRIGY